MKNYKIFFLDFKASEKNKSLDVAKVYLNKLLSQNLSRSDLIIAVGTSSSVRPAAGLSWIAKAEGSKIIEINTNETKLTSECDVVIKGSATDILRKIYNEIINFIQ